MSDSGLNTYAKNIFRDHSIVCGASVDGELRGLVELRRDFHDWSSSREVAFSVEPEWQNLGIGDALFERMYAIAQNRSIRTLQIMCQKDNNRMKHLAIKHHAELRYGEDAVEAVLHPHWPTPVSMAKEIIGETNGHANILFRLRQEGRQVMKPYLSTNPGQ
ncbi:MAG: GNAT family N-acetyltransferase [Sulfitobacter sp.]